MSEVGRSDWSEALQRAFDLRVRLPLSIAGDVLPIAIVADLLDGPHSPEVPWAYGATVAAGAAFACIRVAPGDGIEGTARVVVDELLIQPQGNTDLVVSLADTDYALTGAAGARAWSCNPGVQEEGTPVEVRTGTEGAALAVAPVARVLGLSNEVYAFSGPWVLRPGFALYASPTTAAVDMRVTVRGRVFGG